MFRLVGKRESKTFLTRVAWLFVAALILMTSAQGAVPVPHTPKAKGDQCVEETGFMRRNHMDLLMHQRDATLRQGIRGKKHSLNGCLNCHAVKGENGQPVSAKSNKHFCNSCHQYAAVKIDCFDCHASTPGDDKRIVSTKQ